MNTILDVVFLRSKSQDHGAEIQRRKSSCRHPLGGGHLNGSWPRRLQVGAVPGEWNEMNLRTSLPAGMEEETLYSSFLLVTKDFLHDNLTPLDVHGEGKAGWRTGLWAGTEVRWDQSPPAWGDWGPIASHCERQNQNQVRVQGYRTVPQIYQVC